MSHEFPDQIELLRLNDDHLQVLASAPCTEVFSAFLPSEPLSIREVAQELGKSPAAGGENVKSLVDAGLMIKAGTRKRRSRIETLYIHKGQTTRLFFDEASPAGLQAYHKRFRGQMRQAERQHELAQKAAQTDSGLFQFIGYTWSSVYLDLESVKKVKRMIADLHREIEALDENDPETRESGDYVRLNISSLVLPIQSESKKRLDK